MKLSTNLFLSALIAIIFTSCVSQKKYQEALTREQGLLARNTELSDEIVKLKGQVETLQKDNAKLIAQIDEALKKYSQASGQANLTQKQLEAEQQRLLDLRRLLQQQSDAVENLRKKMAEALTGFNSNELTVITKNGRVYVSLQESLLFPAYAYLAPEKVQSQMLLSSSWY